jgi:probable F420-dependent oxidoreductase
MEVTVALPHTGKLASPKAIARVAVEAERMGCATVWVLERILRPTSGGMPESYANVYDPLETLAYVAAITERVRLGTSIMDALFHVPAALARRFATLDHLSKGRVIAGLGQGYAPEEFVAANVPMSRRGAGFEEFIRAMKAAWGPDPVRFSGRLYSIPESEINPKPVQVEGPPILIAAMKGAAIERAGRLGFGLNPLPPSWEILETSLDSFRKSARAAGHDAAALPIVVRSNTAVGKVYAPEGEPPLSGPHEKVVDDLTRMREMGIDEVFFDMNRYAVSVDEQLRILDRLRSAVA